MSRGAIFATDHTLTFEDHHKSLMQARKREKSKTRAREALLKNFVRMRSGRLSLYNNRAEATTSGLHRTDTPGDIFIRFADEEFVDELIQTTQQQHSKDELPYTFQLTPNAQRRLIYQYFCQRIIILASPAKCLRQNFPCRVFERPIGELLFQRLLKCCNIGFDLAAKLDRRYSLFMRIGRVTTLDEKLQPFKGESPHKRYVPNKQPKNGHWITELTTKGQFTGLPFALRQLPLLGNCSTRMVEIFSWATQGFSQLFPPIIITDAYYLDDASLVLLRSQKSKFLCAVNPVRFKELWEQCAKDVKKIGDSCIYRNSSTNEVGMMVWDAQFGKRYLLTNAFEYMDDPLTEINSQIITDAYGFYFNSCDRFNHLIAKLKWPYRRSSWENNYDSFYFSMLVMNVYVAYHEVRHLETRMEWEEFGTLLATSLQQVVTTKYPFSGE